MNYSELVAASQPEAIKAAIAANADQLHDAAHAHHSGGVASVRTAVYKGHEIVVKTTYEITIDREPFDVHVSVDNGGRVHYHGLPTRDFTSTVELVKKVIDSFPDEFSDGPQGQAHADPHESGEGH